MADKCNDIYTYIILTGPLRHLRWIRLFRPIIIKLAMG